MDKQIIMKIFGVGATSLMLIAGYLFFSQVRQKKSTPNITTWFICLLVGLVNSFTFYQVVNQSIFKGLIMFTSLLTQIIVFFYTIKIGRFAKSTLFDKTVLVAAIFVLVIWILPTSNDRSTNFLIQLVSFSANSATIIGLWRGTLKEHYAAWLFAVGAYLCIIVSIAIDFQGDWLQFFRPILNGVIANGSIAILSLKKHQKIINKKE